MAQQTELQAEIELVTVDRLQNIEALKEVPADQLQWFIDNSRHYIAEAGTVLFEPGIPIVGTHVIISGDLSFYMIQNGSKREISDFTVGTVTGSLPYSRAKVSSGYGVARTRSQLMTFPSELMMDMIKNHFDLTQALVHVMSTRVRDFTARQQQNEKMMALGKLSAGMAHELNNPAAAIVRDSVSLRKHLQYQPESLKEMVTIKLTDSQIDTLNDKLTTILSCKKPERLTLRQRSAQEEELGDWFDDKEVKNAYEIAETFVDAGISVEHLGEISENIPAQYFSSVFNWMNKMLITERMVEDIQESARRIAELVTSVKTFTHMDRASDKQYADIHTGIGNTLTMMGYKVRKNNISVVEDFDETLPKVKAYIGELNQVWTNLIDNALDALEQQEKGIITIQTQKDREFARISIIDNGPGIPADIQSRIFDPFFTTKEMGKGTGMGLEVVQNIVHQHHGTIKVKSVPGRTEFTVCIPIDG